MSHPWIVVEFNVDGTSAVVHHSWIVNGDKCYWPPATWNSLKTVKAAQTAVKPDEYWGLYDCTILKKYRELFYNVY